MLCTSEEGQKGRQKGNNHSVFLAGFPWSTGVGWGAWREGETLALGFLHPS